MRCTSYCITKKLDLEILAKHYANKYESKRYENALHLKFKENEDIFIIYGAIVFWNLSKLDEGNFINSIKRFTKKTVKQVNSEEMEFNYAKDESVRLDLINIKKEKHIYSKLAVSYGLAQSSMLSHFEDKVDRTIDKYEDIVYTLSQKGTIALSNKEVSKKLGYLFLVRNHINMQSDILDTPIFVWNNPEYEKLYNETIHEMSLNSRTSILNKRLDIMQDLFDILNTQITSNHTSRLEWIIIWLIFIEIVISLFFHLKV